MHEKPMPTDDFIEVDEYFEEPIYGFDPNYDPMPQDIEVDPDTLF